MAVAFVAAAGWTGRKTWQVVRRVIHFLDDYGGQPERDGMPARPGLMARLQSVEEALAHVVTETSPNHGRSIRDIVLRTATDVTDIKQEQTRVREDLARMQEGGSGK